MTDVYESATTSPAIHTRLLDELDWAALRLCGFEANGDTQGYWWFYADDGVFDLEAGVENLDETEKASLREVVALLRRDKPETFAEGSWRWALARYLDGETDSEDLCEYGHVEIFRSLLRKPENTGEIRADHLSVKGGFWSSRPVQDGFGGWITVITPECTRWVNTHEIERELLAKCLGE